MKLSGHLTLEIINEITGEVVDYREQDNIITDIAYSNMMRNVNLFYWEAQSIFISTETATPIRSKTSIQCSGTAAQGSGQPPIQAFHNANPPYFVITQRLEPVTTPRTFQTVGLTPNNVGQVVNTTVPPHAYLLLSTPCTQELQQVVNLTYRITVQNTTAIGATLVANPRWINSMCLALALNKYGSAIFPEWQRILNTVVPAPLKEYGWNLLFISPQLTPVFQFGGQTINLSQVGGNQNTLFYRFKGSVGIARDNNQSSGSNGRIFNGLLTGGNLNLEVATSQVVEGDPGITRTADRLTNLSNITSASNLQSAFAYSASPRDDLAGMFLPDNNPSGTGLIQFSETPWTEKWPSIYRIRITEGGQVGTAKFVLGVKRFGGHGGDQSFTYSSSGTAFHPYIYCALQPYNKCHGWQYVAPIIAWDNYLTVQADKTGISIINQFTGQHFDFDSTTTPALPITNFRQFALDQPNNLIYVACSATGLWKINISNINSPVITRESITPTYAVDVTATGIVYAFMNLATTIVSLTSSTSSYTTNLGFTSVALTTANWLNLHINKIHPDTRIAITVRDNAIVNGLRGARVYWWSLANGNSSNNITTLQQYVGEHQANYAWSKGSNNRLWSGDGTLLSFNSSTIIRQNPGNLFALNALPQYGIESYRQLDGVITSSINTFGNACVAQDYWGNFVSNADNGKLYLSSTGAELNTYNTNSRTQKQTLKRVSLPNGIILCDTVSSNYWTTGSNNDISKWIWYKWNGTNWITSVTYNNDTAVFTDTTATDTRITSNTPIDLIDGIRVTFTNGATGNSFFTNEVYDQYVCNGFMKTNDTSFVIENVVGYSQPLFEKITLTPTIIRAPNNHGVVVDGAPGNLTLSAAVSAITINPLWHSIIPEYELETMTFAINGIPIIYANTFVETINTLPAQNTLTIGQIIVYRNGLILCSTADVGKTLTGYFSYVARSD